MKFVYISSAPNESDNINFCEYWNIEGFRIVIELSVCELSSDKKVENVNKSQMTRDSSSKVMPAMCK